MSEDLVQKLCETIDADPVALEENGFPAAQIEELQSALAQSAGEALIGLGMGVLQVATGLSNIGHETPVAQLKALLDEIAPRVRTLAAERGSDSDAAHLSEAGKLVGTKGKPLPAKPGDAKPDGAVSVQAFKIPVR